MRNVILIGFMGTGKSSTGKMLAQRLGCAFIDMDNKIEEEAGLSIPEIFAKLGEDHFRQLEHELAVRLSKRRNAVISTGGGTVKNPANVEALKSNDGDRRQAVEKLLKERETLYQQADFSVDTSDLSPLQVVEIITKTLKTRGVLHA